MVSCKKRRKLMRKCGSLTRKEIDAAIEDVKEQIQDWESFSVLV